MKRPKAADVPQTGFHFDDASHSYLYDGRPMTGCTTILGVLAKPALIGWAARMAVEYIEAGWPAAYANNELQELFDQARTAHAKKRDKAADVGTDLHALVEQVVRWAIAEHDGCLPANMQMDGKIDSFIHWAQKENIRFIATEQRLYSKELWVAGTCDLIFEKDGKRYVGDIKTYKKIWDRVPLIQCAGYALMWEEMRHNGKIDDILSGKIAVSGYERERVDGYCVICLPKERAFNEAEDVLWSWDTEGDREAFLSCVKLYRYLNQK